MGSNILISQKKRCIELLNKQKMPHLPHFICQLHLKHNNSLELHAKLLKIHGFRNPPLKIHEFRGTNGTHAYAATA